MASDIKETPFVKQLAANGTYLSRFAILVLIAWFKIFVRGNARIEGMISSHIHHVYMEN